MLDRSLHGLLCKQSKRRPIISVGSSGHIHIFCILAKCGADRLCPEADGKPQSIYMRFWRKAGQFWEIGRKAADSYFLFVLRLSWTFCLAIGLETRARQLLDLGGTCAWQLPGECTEQSAALQTSIVRLIAMQLYEDSNVVKEWGQCAPWLGRDYLGGWLLDKLAKIRIG